MKSSYFDGEMTIFLWFFYGFLTLLRPHGETFSPGCLSQLLHEMFQAILKPPAGATWAGDLPL
jgi:hypothetical protein